MLTIFTTFKSKVLIKMQEKNRAVQNESNEEELVYVYYQINK